LAKNGWRVFAVVRKDEPIPALVLRSPSCYSFIQVPYDSGYKDYRMGRGPGHILRHLKTEKNFPIDEVEVQGRFALEVGTSFAVARQLAEKFATWPTAGISPWC
jgi:hypothetical protein